MKKVVKQVAGVDVAQKELVVCLGRMHDDWTPQLYANKTFPNTPKGIEALVNWASKQSDKNIAVHFVMEATGVYHERLAYHLDSNNKPVSIVLPNKMSNYMRTLDTNTVTDKMSAQAIAQFGLERTLSLWHRPKETYRRMRQLTREREQLVAECTVLKNFLHAEQAEAIPDRQSIARINKRLALANKQQADIMKSIEALIKVDEEVKEQVETITTIPGVGTLTAARILAETNGFDLISSRRQLASYAGFDVKEKQSGTSVKGIPKISKKGNKHLRKAMHLPALSTIKHDERYKAIYIRQVSKHGIKMKAAVSIQRKVLELAFTLCKTKTKYDKNYLKQGDVVDENLAVGEKIREAV